MGAAEAAHEAGRNAEAASCAAVLRAGVPPRCGGAWGLAPVQLRSAASVTEAEAEEGEGEGEGDAAPRSPRRPLRRVATAAELPVRAPMGSPGGHGVAAREWEGRDVVPGGAGTGGSGATEPLRRLPPRRAATRHGDLTASRDDGGRWVKRFMRSRE